MNDSIVKYGEGTVNSRFLRELADQMEKNEVNQERLLSENTALKIENKSLKEENEQLKDDKKELLDYGTLIPSIIDTGVHPKLTTTYLQSVCNNNAERLGWKKIFTRREINEAAKELGYCTLNGPDIDTGFEPYAKKKNDCRQVLIFSKEASIKVINKVFKNNQKTLF